MPAFPGTPIARWTWALVACLAVALIGLVDHATGPRWGFSLFYLAPVLLVGWRFGRGPALAVAVSASAAWFVADAAWYRDVAPSVWNSVTRLAMYSALGVMTATLRRERIRLRELLAHEQELARTDPLTGLLNSRAFYERIGAELARGRRRPVPVAVVYLDLDNFKRVNDRVGHAAGDTLLAAIGGALHAVTRTTDAASRLGGDEFGILLVDVDRAGADGVAKRILAAVDEAAAAYADLSVGASLGLAWFATPPEDAETMVHAADEAMYRAKAAGKHRCELAGTTG